MSSSSCSCLCHTAAAVPSPALRVFKDLAVVIPNVPCIYRQWDGVTMRMFLGNFRSHTKASRLSFQSVLDLVRAGDMVEVDPVTLQPLVANEPAKPGNNQPEAERAGGTPLAAMDWVVGGPWVVKLKGSTHAFPVSEVTEQGVKLGQAFFTPDEAADQLLRSNDGVTFVPCVKAPSGLSCAATTGGPAR